MRPLIGVLGPGRGATATDLALAGQVGGLLAASGALLVCGGLGGVMAAACQGALSAGGTTLGFLPGHDRAEANQHLTIAIPTGLGELRNGLIVNAADAFVAIGGSWGTLSEVALALRAQKQVFALNGWSIRGEDRAIGGVPIPVRTAAEAVDGALAASGRPDAGHHAEE